jgi:hypothetical protein
LNVGCGFPAGWKARTIHGEGHKEDAEPRDAIAAVHLSGDRSHRPLLKFLSELEGDSSDSPPA